MSSVATYAGSMPGKRSGKLRSDSVFKTDLMKRSPLKSRLPPLCSASPFPPTSIDFKRYANISSVKVKEAMPGLHYNSNIAEPIKATSPMLHWGFGRHFSVLFFSQTLQDCVNTPPKREQNQGLRPKCSKINKGHDPSKGNGHSVQQGAANSQKKNDVNEGTR